MSDNAVISVKNLKTYFYTNERCNRAINGVSMDIKSGKTLCIVCLLYTSDAADD